MENKKILMVAPPVRKSLTFLVLKYLQISVHSALILLYLIHYISIIVAEIKFDVKVRRKTYYSVAKILISYLLFGSVIVGIICLIVAVIKEKYGPTMAGGFIFILVALVFAALGHWLGCLMYLYAGLVAICYADMIRDHNKQVSGANCSLS